eukprot:7801629-Heterocapsa_arctica.AAC.1
MEEVLKKKIRRGLIRHRLRFMIGWSLSRPAMTGWSLSRMGPTLLAPSSSRMTSHPRSSCAARWLSGLTGMA